MRRKKKEREKEKNGEGKSKVSPVRLAASNNVFALYSFVPLTQYGVKKIMKMTVFLFSKFIRLPFFLALKVSYRINREANFLMFFRC